MPAIKNVNEEFVPPKPQEREKPPNPKTLTPKLQYFKPHLRAFPHHQPKTDTSNGNACRSGRKQCSVSKP